jgi:hypothetical protein
MAVQIKNIFKLAKPGVCTMQIIIFKARHSVARAAKIWTILAK